MRQPFQDSLAHSGFPTMSRRTFIKTSGAGITLFFALNPVHLFPQRGRDYPEDLNAYLHIRENGRISCFTGKIEMGQGIITSLAQMLAEEMNVPLDSVDMVMGDTDLCPYDGGTTGSRSTKFFGPALRRAAAEAKAVLVDLAAERMNIDKHRLVVRDGKILDSQTNKSLTYADLAAGQKIERNIQGEVQPEPVHKHTLCGQPVKHTDARLKVTGAAKFAADIRLENMLYARVVRPPSHGAKLISIHTEKARSVAGARIIEEQDLVAVLHEKPYVADKAFAMIETRFDKGSDQPDNDSIFDLLEKSGTAERTVTEQGDLATGEQSSQKIVEATYYNHYVAHAPLETHSITAKVDHDSATLWVSTQTPFRIQPDIAEALGLPNDKVRIITPFVGGGFGGKKGGEFFIQAARLAQITGQPVQLVLTRADEFHYDHFRPAALVKARTGLDGQGKIALWDLQHFFPGSRSSEPIYDIPHYRVLSKGTARGQDSPHPFDTGAWRGPGSNTNVFAMESQTDLMAQAAGIDPLTFRLNNLNDPRMRRVLQAAAEKFDHPFKPLPSGDGVGIACTNYLNTYVATIAKVQVDKQTGQIKVERMVCAQDMGEIINPQGARLQIEGGLIMGLGYCLGEEIKFKGGTVLTQNFGDYDMTRFSWTPHIDAILIENPDLDPQGCGEPAITTTGGVLANAVADAMGTRLYTLPMTPERIRNALAK